MKISKKIFKWIGNVLIGFLVLLILYSFIAVNILKRDYINVFGYTFFVVATGSMADTINVNDIIVVKLNDTYEINDIITYRKDDMCITHRIVSINDGSITTKGDSNNTEDDIIKSNDIIGKVVMYFPLKKLIRTLEFLVLIVIIILIFNFSNLFKKYLVKKSKKQICKQNIPFNDGKVIKKFMCLLIERNKKAGKEIDDRMIIKLRCITKSMELFNQGHFDLLSKLIDACPVVEVNEKVVDEELIMELSKEQVDTYVIILLNAVTYNDEIVFDVVFKCFKIKIIREYLEKKK